MDGQILQHRVRSCVCVRARACISVCSNMKRGLIPIVENGQSIFSLIPFCRSLREGVYRPPPPPPPPLAAPARDSEKRRKSKTIRSRNKYPDKGKTLSVSHIDIYILRYDKTFNSTPGQL